MSREVVNRNLLRNQKFAHQRRALVEISNKVAGDGRDDTGGARSRKGKKRKTPADSEADDTLADTDADDTLILSDTPDEELSTAEYAPTPMDISEEKEEVQIPEVDVLDRNDPQFVVEYVADVFLYLKKQELRSNLNPEYMQNQTDINKKMRSILVDWLVEVHEKFKLQEETLFLTVNILDRFLASQTISRKKLQLVGCTAMLLASKYQEIYSPEIRDFVFISDKACSKPQILAMEAIILEKLKFKLTVPSSLLFLVRFHRISQTSSKVLELSICILTIALHHIHVISIRPSLLAASALFMAMKFVEDKNWPLILVEQTGYEEEALKWRELYSAILQTSPKLKAAKKKYSSSKHSCVYVYITSMQKKHGK